MAASSKAQAQKELPLRAQLALQLLAAREIPVDAKVVLAQVLREGTIRDFVKTCTTFIENGW